MSKIKPKTRQEILEKILKREADFLANNPDNPSSPVKKQKEQEIAKIQTDPIFSQTKKEMLKIAFVTTVSVALILIAFLIDLKTNLLSSAAQNLANWLHL
ncbi:MAG: hypothetical protein CEN89_678 [Candidatus Berkelbacteria bacterium Licking1014_7]|uniref:Uncharacterized protein n=1 Tax=Candidatus Berkelbacteria bacterium Licking1014_7 TaxID=2017147 RepID=A0A554LHZ2_9BACT|nr:MAG: hypothetical protein CEN89_678 [Candidatus Berkelbacteria bacterium Licking1014_7]